MHRLPDTLIATLSQHIDLSKSRLETFATLIIGCICARTVNLSHIAAHFDSGAQIASNYRRLQRFFQYVRLDEAWLARVILALIGTQPPYTFILDRTNWKIGRTDINLLVLCVAARRVRVPVLWSILGKAGSSNLAERTALMKRALQLVKPSSIRVVLADREFIGHQWFDFLAENCIPFAIRVKQDLYVRLKDGRVLTLASLFKKHRSTRRGSAYEGLFVGMRETSRVRLWFCAKRLCDKDRSLLIVATTLAPEKGLALYRKRWQIECLFADTKTRGLNLEDTRLTNPGKLSVLIAIIALAIVWSHLSASRLKGHQNIKRASHGFRRKSWFRVGFDGLRQWIICDPEKAAQVWNKLWKRSKSIPIGSGVV